SCVGRGWPRGRCSPRSCRSGSCSTVVTRSSHAANEFRRHLGYPPGVMERLRTPGFGRALLWGSGLVLIAGVVAFITVSLGNNDSSPPAADRGTAPCAY